MTKNKTDELDSTNVQESADLARQQVNKILTAIAIEATEYAEKLMRMVRLKDKLTRMWLSAPEETDSTELRTKIDAACNSGERSMEELLIELMETAQIDGNAEESIMSKPLNLTNDEINKLMLDEEAFRISKLKSKLYKLSDMSEGTDFTGLWTEIGAACGYGERAMEELLFKLMGSEQTDADVEELIMRKTQHLTNDERDKWKEESRKDELRIKLLHALNILSASSPKSGAELWEEIEAAYDDGVSATEELWNEWMETLRNQQTLNASGSAIPTPTPTPTPRKR